VSVWLTASSARGLVQERRPASRLTAGLLNTREKRYLEEMKAETKQSLIPIALILVVVALLFYIFTGEQDSTPTQETVAQKGTESVEITPEEVSEEASKEPDEREQVKPGSGTAKRIKARPDQTSKVTAPKSEENSETEWGNDFVAESTLESALGGDINDSIAVSELTGQCRAGYDNEKSVQSNLTRRKQSVAKGQALPGIKLQSTGETLTFNKFDDYENYVWDRFAECQSTRGMFNKGLRERLAQLAEEGNVNARYLYAMWVPIPTGSNEDQLIEWMTYQSLAMDFTWQNIREGEPLGLLAYGRSLEQAGHVYFTPPHMRYGPVFIMAAHKCGLDNNIVNRKVDTMSGYWKTRKMTQMTNKVETLSDKLVKTFCH